MTLKIVIATLLTFVSSEAFGQPAFEVASIKPNTNGPAASRRSSSANGMYTAEGFVLTLLIQSAYHLKGYQISGGSRWMYYDPYDVIAKAEGNANPDEIPLMLQTLLADRFKLTFHREMKELPVYSLVVGKDGPKLKKSSETTKYSLTMRTNGWEITHLDMPGLAMRLSRELGRTVVDNTGLSGAYDFMLDWAREHASPPGANGVTALPESGAPSLFTAVQEQLGLKLESRKQSIEMLVIDQAERPSPN